MRFYARFTSLAPLALASFVAIACGDHPSLTSPTTPTSTGTTIVTAGALIAGGSLAGVTVSGGGMSATTDATGTATFNQVIAMGMRLTFTLGGYRPREASFRGNGTGETLMVSLADDVFRGVGFKGGNITSRFANGTRACVVPDLEFRGDLTMQQIRPGVSWVAALPGLAEAGVSFEMTTSPEGNCLVVPIKLDPNIKDEQGRPIDGQAFVSGNPVTSALILVRLVGHVSRQLIAHEVGHVLGFGHNPQADGMMCTCADYRTTGFNQTEQMIAKWLYARTPRTMWEDREP